MLNRIKRGAERLGVLDGVALNGNGEPVTGQTEAQQGLRALLARDIGLFRFLVLLAQLALVLAVIYQFRIEETSGLLRIIGVIFGGFVVHTWLARRFRLPFFVLLSMVAIEAVFGATNALWLVGIGLGLIGLCHLPIAFWARVALIGVTGAGLAVMQAGWVVTSWSGAILPILGSMFMFRLIIYLYDLRHEKTPASLWERLAYFFLLPNVCFPLFPVVDYQLFRRTYYNEDASAIYQKGVLWIFRGVTHLLIYRLIYYYVVPTPSEVQGLGEVLVYIVSSYLLYLRVSGLFHMIIGILCLFGFNLPETHHLYFFASGFNDVWRRLNIYWKDFMVKIFYYPVLMRARRWGMTPARVAATAVVFLATWLLHSYQWFWLQGAFPLTAVDGLYWGLLGALVIANTLYVAGQLKKPPAEEPTWTWQGAWIHALKVVGMFVVMSVLWSFWSSHSITEWASTVATASSSGIGAYGLLVAGLAALVGLGVLLQYAAHRGWSLTVEGGAGAPSFARPALYTLGAASLLLALSVPQAQEQLGTRGAGIVASIQESRLNQRDQDRMTRGYYEGLLDGENSYTSELWWAVQARQPRDWKPLYETEAVRAGEGVFDYVLIPSYDGVQKQAPFRTNEWGMRDQAYDREKPSNTFRIALLGASIEMGAGVEGDQTYEALLEARLNEELADASSVQASNSNASYQRYEILNFAVGAYSVIQNGAMMVEKVPPFDPDLVFYAVGSTEEQRLLMQLVNLIRQERPIRYPALQTIIAQSGVTAEMEVAEIRRRMTPYIEDIIQWGFDTVATTAQQHGIDPVLIYVPNLDEIGGLDRAWEAKLIRFAETAGFTVVNLEGAYDGHDKASIQLAPWDWHLGVRGHQLVADQLYEQLRAKDILPLPPVSSDPSNSASARAVR